MKTSPLNALLLLLDLHMKKWQIDDFIMSSSDFSPFFFSLAIIIILCPGCILCLLDFYFCFCVYYFPEQVLKIPDLLSNFHTHSCFFIGKCRVDVNVYL